MKNLIKTYLVGLLAIGAAIQPWFFGQLIGINMTAGSPFFAYAWAVIIEALIIVLLCGPYLIGRKILEK